MYTIMICVVLVRLIHIQRKLAYSLLLVHWLVECHLCPCCRTPLMLGVSAGHSDCVVMLLKYGANASLVDEDQHPALFRAVSGSVVI